MRKASVFCKYLQSECEVMGFGGTCPSALPTAGAVIGCSLLSYFCFLGLSAIPLYRIISVRETMFISCPAASACQGKPPKKRAKEDDLRSLLWTFHPLVCARPPAAIAPLAGLEAGGFSRGKSLSDGCSQVRRSATLAGVMFSLPLVGAWYAEAGGWARGERRLISKSYYRPKKKITADSQHQPPVSGNKIQ